MSQRKHCVNVCGTRNGIGSENIWGNGHNEFTAASHIPDKRHRYISWSLNFYFLIFVG